VVDPLTGQFDAAGDPAKREARWQRLQSDIREALMAKKEHENES